MKQRYMEIRFRSATLKVIAIANAIIAEYQEQGFVLTVRQLYYQLVARDVIANTMLEYKRIARNINDAKLAGLVDWDAIEDRTREFLRMPHWASGKQILQGCAEQYHMDMWAQQGHRVFVIVEKEALVGVLHGICSEFDMPLLAARGYPSGSVLREFALSDVVPALREGQAPILLHLGDHDPSGMDMSRDLTERMTLFSGRHFMFERIALNMDQVEELKPPENPAKVTDSRFDSYRHDFGESSWELDALSPTYLADLIRGKVTPYIDKREWENTQALIAATKERIAKAAKRFKVTA